MGQIVAQKWTLKTPGEIEAMRATGIALAAALRAMRDAIVPGKTTTGELDDVAGEVLKRFGAKSALFGYKPPWTDDVYLHNSCISVGDEVIHGVPNRKRKLREDCEDQPPKKRSKVSGRLHVTSLSFLLVDTQTACCVLRLCFVSFVTIV